MLCPPILARAAMVKCTVAILLPAGRADVICSDVTVNRGPLIIDRKQAR